MKAVKLIAVFTENKPGQAARITKTIAEAGANIRMVTIASSGNFGVMKLLVDKCEPAMEKLKTSGFAVNYLEAVGVELKDKPGSMQAVAECLMKHNINLQNTSGFVANNRAILVLEVQDVAKTSSILEKEGLRVLSQQELLTL